MAIQNKGIFAVNLLFIVVFLSLTILSGDLSMLGLTLFFVATLVFQIFNPNYSFFSKNSENRQDNSWKSFAAQLAIVLIIGFSFNGFAFSRQFLNSALIVLTICVATFAAMTYSENH